MLTVSWPAAAQAEDWPHWRGPQRNGTTPEPSGWNGQSWLPNAPAWRANVGEGSSSPIVVGERVYTMGWRHNQDHVQCLNAATGETLWSRTYPARRYGRNAMGDEGMYSGPSATPEYDADTGLLYTISLDGDLNCWDTRRNGERVWGVNLHNRFEILRRPKVGRSGQRDYGFTASPFVYHDWLIIEVGGQQATVAAFDKRTGKPAWQSEYRGPAGHTAGGTLVEVQSTPCLAVMTHFHLVVLRLDGDRAGRTVATFPWETEFSNNIAAPASAGNVVLITSAYNHHAMCALEISPRNAKRLWQINAPSKVCTPVIHKGHVYWAWQQLHCVELATGKLLWKGGQFGDPGSCIVTGDDRLIVWGERGRLALVETAARSPDGYRELAAVDRLSTTDAWPHVVLSGGRLFCKDRQGEVWCFSTSATGG